MTPDNNGRTRLLLGFAALLTALAGCANGTPAPPPPPPPVSPPPSPPPVSLAGDPCRALTQTQLIKFLGDGFKHIEGVPSDSGMAQTCGWANNDLGNRIIIQFVYMWTNGLDAVRATKVKGGFYLELQPVQGYPVIAYGAKDERPDGRCGVAVGIADNAAFEADAETPRANRGRTDACQAARQVADAVVSTLKAGA